MTMLSPARAVPRSARLAGSGTDIPCPPMSPAAVNGVAPMDQAHCLSGRFGSCSTLRQNLQQRLQVALILAPPANRAGEHRLAYLPAARGHDRPLGLMEVEAGGLPIEVEELDQAPALALQIRDQGLVVDRQHAQRQHMPPVLRQPLDLQSPRTAIGEVGIPYEWLIEPVKIARQTRSGRCQELTIK